MSRHRSSQSPATHIRRHPQARAVLATFAGTLAGAPLITPPVLLAQEGSGPESALKRFDIPSGDLGRALSAAAVRGGVQLSFDPKLTRGKTAPGLSGEFTAREALAKLLVGSGLELVPGPGRTYGLQSVPVAAEEPAKKPVQTEPIEVLEPIEVIGKLLDQDQGFKADMQDSATKFPLSIRETPQSISVMTRDALEARQVIGLGQALETAAGVNQFQGVGPFSGRNSNRQGNTQIRGIFSSVFADRDEGFVSPIQNARPDLAPYERIEVVKGPNSVLYGRTSAGGFVNRVRKKPLGVFASELDASVGSFDFYRAEGDVTGPLLNSGKARGRLVLAYENAGAFVEGVESELVVAAPSLDLDLTPSTRLLLLGSYQRDEFLPNPGVPLVRDGDTVRLPNIRRSLYTGVPNKNENNTEIGVGIAQLEQDLGDRWLATLRLNRTAIRNRTGTEKYAYTYSFLTRGDGDTNLYSNKLNRDDDVWSGELRLNGSLEVLGRPVNLTFGVDHTKLEILNLYGYVNNRNDPGDRANIYEENFADIPIQPTDIYADILEVKEATGVYAQVQVRPFDRLSVLLGGRYDHSDALREGRLGNIPFGGSAPTSEKQDDAYTGRAGLVFDVNQQVSVYGLYAQSFEPVVSVGADGDILEPETGEIFETGIKTEWLDGRLGVNAALFRLDRQDIPIGRDPDGPGGNPPFSVSAGLQRTDGIELEINGEPLPGWNLSFGGSLSDFEFKDGPFVGSTPAGAADWQLGAYTSYEWQAGALKGFGLGAGLYAVDERGVSTFFPGLTMKGYERVDLSLFYNGFKDTKIALQVRNVFDERYIESSSLARNGNFGAPTAVLLTVRFDLDGLLDGLGK